jgi:hypothetical protein
MHRERWVQLIAAGAVVLALAGSIMMVPTIKEQRRDLKPNVDLAGLPPDYALTTTALGPFRGLFVDWLWYRAEHMKREGKIYEVNTLANWITTLQPRFPMVWRFHAWNLAYNISVKTDTPEERWRWVQKGIRLLRNEGIPQNPKSLALYRELGLIFWHKVGQYSDDMHWHYKQQLAERWHRVLGDLSVGVDRQTAVDRMKPIAQLAEQYFRDDEPPKAQRETLTDLAEQYPSHADELEALKSMRIGDALEKLARYRRQWRDRAPELAQALNEVYQALNQHPAVTGRNRLQLLQAQYAETAPIVQQLREAGITFNIDGLQQLGGLLMKMELLSPQVVTQNADRLLSQMERKLLPIVEQYRDQSAFGQVLTFLRAQALTEHYHMDPGFMQHLMEKFGPLDWRHPASHAIYWSALGIARADTERTPTGTSAINTDRQVVHGLQMLFNNGRIELSLSGMSMLPDLRFIESYEKAQFGAVQREAARSVGDGAVNAFETGHKNFLEEAVEKCYLYGDEQRAQKYYQKVREKYGDRARNAYRQPIPEFVAQRMQSELSQDRETTSAFVSMMIRRGLRQGLAQNDPSTFQHFIDVAQAAYQQYHQEGNPGAYQTPELGRGRLTLPPFNKLLVDTYAGLMRDQSVPLFDRAQIYNNSPGSLQRRAYDQFRAQVAKDIEARGMSMDRLFPKPAQAGPNQSPAVPGNNSGGNNQNTPANTSG